MKVQLLNFCVEIYGRIGRLPEYGRTRIYQEDLRGEDEYVLMIKVDFVIGNPCSLLLQQMAKFGSHDHWRSLFVGTVRYLKTHMIELMRRWSSQTSMG